MCITRRNFVIFPDLVLFSKALETCRIHGGNVAVPKSNMENSLMIDIVKKHKKACITEETTKTGMLTWIGAKRSNNTWYELNFDDSRGSDLIYKNLKDDQSQNKDSDCATLDENGYWHHARRLCTIRQTLCTICTITNTPVFTLKGACYESFIDWNYYMTVGNDYQIEHFDGYDDTKLIPLNGNRGWEFRFKIKQKDITLTSSRNISTATYPIGRRKWYMGDPDCNYGNKLKQMTLSQCNFETEFTCDSGHCIEIGNRCNGNGDCADGSDEEECKMVAVPDSYRNKDSPPRIKENRALELYLKVDVMNIESIDTLDMTVVITANVVFKWYDKRLKFLNLFIGRENIVSDHASNKIWLPLHQLILENAIIGGTKYDDHISILASPKSQQSVSPEFSYENVVYDGSNTLLEVNQRMKIKFNCPFEVRQFPFDDQKCKLIFKLHRPKHNNLTFTGDDHVTYNGPSTVDQFTIRPMTSNTSNTEHFTRFVLVIPFSRNPSNQLLKTFIPTFLLGLLGYSTIFIDTKRPGDRFMGSATMILVLATWISVISGDLPKTSYIKLIDIWFVWHVTTTFAIVIYHIILDRLQKTSVSSEVTNTCPQSTENEGPAIFTQSRSDKIIRINRAITKLFTIINFAFYFVYFSLSMN